MTRWTIHSFTLFSHDNRRRDVVLHAGVNIITGDSHTGKSAVPEIIDYCLGASGCHLPGIVRDATSWAGLTLEREAERMAIARRVPRPSENVANDMYVRRGTGDELLPATSSAFQQVGKRPDVMRLIEEALGIGDVLTETPSELPGRRLSARQVLPYMLQDDDVIISKTTLLRGAQDDRRRDLLNSIPYFLRVADESSAALAAERRLVARSLKVEERKIEALERVVASDLGRALGFLTEAVQVGLSAEWEHEPSLEDALSMMKQVLTWQPGQPVSANDGSSLQRAYREQAELRAEIGKLRRVNRSAEQAVGSAAGFQSATEGQVGRLAAIDLFRSPQDSSSCPVCESSLKTAGTAVRRIRLAQEDLTAELSHVRRDRPKLDDYIISNKESIAGLAEALDRVREKIARLVRESDADSHNLDLDHRRSRVVGRISLYLESRDALAVAEQGSKQELIERLEDLDALIDADSKRDLLAIEQQTIGAIATEILRELPFESAYHAATVYFLANTLDVGIVTSSRSISLRDVGSDENYLTLHIATLVALHRFFGRRGSPVPGVLLLDQISRPYYPPDEVADEVIIEKSEDAAALSQYFDFLFNECERHDDFQVIVLEHAYMASDDRYVAAVVERWSKTGTKLVPGDWPLSPAPQSPTPQ